jgi:hypothetical protein
MLQSIAEGYDLLAHYHDGLGIASVLGMLASRARHPLMALAPAAAAACASSRSSCGGNSPSTVRRRFRRRSGSTPHDNLTATTPKKRSPVRSLLSRPRLSSLQRCVHHATATRIFRHTPAHRSEKRVAPELQRHRHHSPHLAADLSCGPLPSPISPGLAIGRRRTWRSRAYRSHPTARVAKASCAIA